jgi:hypothetical protein
MNPDGLKSLLYQAAICLKGFDDVQPVNQRICRVLLP